jgi:hypothetical protein
VLKTLTGHDEQHNRRERHDRQQAEIERVHGQVLTPTPDSLSSLGRCFSRLRAKLVAAISRPVRSIATRGFAFGFAQARAALLARTVELPKQVLDRGVGAIWFENHRERLGCAGRQFREQASRRVHRNLSRPARNSGPVRSKGVIAGSRRGP